MLILTGDLYLGSENISIEKEILNSLNSSDYLISNFENVLANTNHLRREDKASNLQVSKTALDNYIKKFNTKLIFSLANNHIHDLGQNGIDDTIEVLNNYKNVISVGAGFSDDIYKPLVIDSEGKKVGLLFCSTDYPEVMSIIGTDHEKGVPDYNDSKIFEVIRDAKRNVDFFIIVPHWGKEYISLPNMYLRKMAYKWIDAGADMVIGHHPHVIQGKEYYKNGIIYYSLGNFIFPDHYDKNGILNKWNKNNSRSIILKVRFDKDIQVREEGVEFNTDNHVLGASSISLDEFYSKSVNLDYSKLDSKSYNILWEKEYFKILKINYSFLNKVQKLFPTHREYGRFLFFFRRILKKVSRSYSYEKTAQQNNQ